MKVLASGAPPVGASEFKRLRGRIDAHVSAQRGMRRKRVQPRGSKDCMGCGVQISANADSCRSCALCACGHAFREHQPKANVWKENPCRHWEPKQAAGDGSFCGCADFKGAR